jgi:hypothetical protein
MSKSNKNPYNEKSNYGKLFSFMQKQQVFTRAELIAQAKKIGMSNDIEKNKNVSPAQATVTVLLSPRDVKQEGLRGDPRGNLSSKGEVYFVELLNREVGEKQKFRLRWRASVLAKRSRSAVVQHKIVKQEKAKKVAKPAKKVAKPAKKVAKPAKPVETPAETATTEAIVTTPAPTAEVAPAVTAETAETITV